MKRSTPHPMESVPDHVLEAIATGSAVPFDDLEDTALWSDQHRSDPAHQHDTTLGPLDPAHAESQSRHRLYRQPCQKCRGSGKFTSWSGRVVGPCFKCDGRGYFETRTSPETLKARQVRRTERRDRTRQENQDSAQTFLDTHPDIATWLRVNVERGNEFAISLNEALRKYGSWTERQLAIVTQRANEYAERRQAQSAARPVDPTGLDLASLPAGTYAVPNGDTRLKVRIDKPTKGKWAGWTFVKDGAEYGARRRYGKQPPQGRYTGDIEPALRAILQDPKAAMAAYGHLTGQCGICNRHLEDETSVALGIGPVCRRKYGW